MTAFHDAAPCSALAAAMVTAGALANNYIVCDPYDGFALDFDGATNQVQMGAATELEMTSSMTLEAWIHPTGPGLDGAGIVGSKEGEYLLARFADGTMRYSLANSSPGWGWVDTGYEAPLDVWTHVALVYDAGLIRLYANGQLEYELAGSGDIADVNGSMNDFRVGGREAVNFQYFDGRIDELRLWNTARTQEAIQNDIKDESTTLEGLVGYWRFDEGASIIAEDQAGGNDGVLIGADWFATEVCILCGPYDGFALDLDGVDDYVQIGPASPLEVSDLFTLEAWIYPTGSGSGGASGGIVINKEGEYEIARFADGTIRWALALDAPDDWTWRSTGFVAPLEAWSHIALVFFDGVVRFYANGELIQTYVASGNVGDAVPDSDDLRIGGRQTGDQHFDGRIDDVRVWTTARTEAEIQAAMQTLPDGSEPGLAGAWSFDEGSGEGTADATGLHDGQLVGTFWHETNDCDACTGDVTGDGTVDVQDLIEVVLAWGVCGSLCPADVTEDGVIDVQDLIEVVLGWGDC